MTNRHLFLILVTGLLLLLAGSKTTTQAAEQQLAAAKSVKFAATAPGGVKICSAVEDSHWRDTINVPDSFTPEACHGFATSVGAGLYQLGCIFPDSMSWSPNFNSGTPSPNCGW